MWGFSLYALGGGKSWDQDFPLPRSYLQKCDRWTQLRLQQSGESAVRVVVRPQFPLQKLVIHRLWLKCTAADLILGREKKHCNNAAILFSLTWWSLLQQCWNLMFNFFDSDCIGWTIHCLKLLDHQGKSDKCHKWAEAPARFGKLSVLLWVAYLKRKWGLGLFI